MLVLSHRRRRGSPAVPSHQSTGRACHRSSYGCCLAQISSPPPLSMCALCVWVPSRSLSPVPNPSSMCDFSCTSLCLSAHPRTKFKSCKVLMAAVT
ncbi:hypothetical protein PVAP13_5KG073787 [Panicum virgatum]|uniref:Uncharacterized protein n=1 Tax=Panicum virgatum TaxID=38727 RepID=A0A8T0S9Z6_PANVG|nr:hypothetical protein PVAP13_5KG073787 [Panicum virgatum]